MKEKIIDFSNGIFSYDQVRLTTEPERIEIELDPGKGVKGDLIVSSQDERRVKGMIFSRVPGLTFQKSSFFGRAARLEYTYYAEHLRPGETFTESLWIESNAGEYEIPVSIRIRSQEPAVENLEDLALPEETEEPEENAQEKPCRGKGRSEAWLLKRKREQALAGLQLCMEKSELHTCSRKDAVKEFRTHVDTLLELDSDHSAWMLLNAWVMGLENRQEEAGWILRKYEKTRLFQQRDVRTKELYLYVNSIYRKDGQVTEQAVVQLRKFYQKYPEDWMLTYFLLKLDPELLRDKRTRYRILERQYRMGTRHRLLYLEAWNLLSEDAALFQGLDGFVLQICAWASEHGLLTSQIALLAAGQAVRLKRWSPLAVRLLKGCYQKEPCKETVGAVCAVYIRGHRTDKEAFGWYEKGVELDAKITNLYEYFIYSLPEDYDKLLPRQILLYFEYHNTLTSRQKTVFYSNLVRFGAIRRPEYEEHRKKMQEFLLQQVKERRINEELAWLYGRCLLPETLDNEELTAVAELLFTRKVTCEDRRIRQIKVVHAQLERPQIVPLQNGTAQVQVYTPRAKVVLIDEAGREHVGTVKYNLKRLMIEPRFLQMCLMRLKNNRGLNIYLVEGGVEGRLTHDNVDAAYRLLEDQGLSETYAQQLKLKVLDYEKRHRRLEPGKELDERLVIEHPEKLSREDQAAYLEILIYVRKDEEAYALLKETGCKLVDPRSLLKLLQRLLSDERDTKEHLRPFAREVFRKGVYTEKIVALLAEELKGNTEELLRLWKAADQFGLALPELEDTLLAQSLFTEHMTEEVFPVFQQVDDRGGDPVMISAWLNYMSWKDFVKNEPVPEGFFQSLEHHLMWEDHLCTVAELSVLRQYSALLLLTDAQKRLAGRLLKEPSIRRTRFAFMDQLVPLTDEIEYQDARTVLEYRCDPSHKVILHYVLEYHGKRTFDYMTVQLFPVCGGIFVKSFPLFYGERLTWFFTEEKPDGTVVSTVSKTLEQQQDCEDNKTRYERLCRMQRALDLHQEKALRRMMAEYEELLEITQDGFRAR